MKPTVVIAYQDFGDAYALERRVLAEIDADVRTIGRDLTTPEARAALAGAAGLLVTLEPVSAATLDAAPTLRVIGRAGTGLDAIDLAAATARGIQVTYVPDYGVDEVSTHAIALVLAQARNIVDVVNAARAGAWQSTGGRTLHRLAGQTLGVVGFGRIGQAVAQKGTGLGLRVIAFDPVADEAVAARLGVQLVDLETLTRASDYITLHTPLLDSTRQMVNAPFLAQMKPTAYLVNTARGPLVDEAALLAAVQAGTIAGAALDVLTHEPPPADHPLLHEPRILITCHSAWYSEESKIDMRLRCVEDVARVLKGEAPQRPANRLG